MKYYVYGMRLRGFAPGCQPSEGLICWLDCKKGSKYHSVISYCRELTPEELAEYELDYLDSMEVANE